LPSGRKRYRGPADLPQSFPVFPLRGAILLPRAQLPLNVFEPRYLEMVEDAIGGARVLAIVQPATGDGESPPGKSVELRHIGCVGRISAYEELPDGRLHISLAGIARCTLGSEIETPKAYRLFAASFERFMDDFTGSGEVEVDRERLLRVLEAYLKTRRLQADWGALARAPTEWLVNSLAVASPYGPEEKQALLEASDLKARADMLVALAEMEMAGGDGGAGTTLQ